MLIHMIECPCHELDLQTQITTPTIEKIAQMIILETTTSKSQIKPFKGTKKIQLKNH